MRVIASSAIFAAALAWMGSDSAGAQGMRRGGYATHSMGSYQGPARGGASTKGNRYTPPYGGSKMATPFSWRMWRSQTAPRYGTASAAPASTPSYNAAHRPPRWRSIAPVVATVAPVLASVPPPARGVRLPPDAQVGRSGGGGAPPAGIVAPDDQRFVPDEILVRFNAGASPAVIGNFARTQRLALLATHQLPLINTALYRFRITDQRSVPAALSGLRGDAQVAAAQPNYLYALRDAGASGSGSPQQYIASKMHLTQAHAIARGNGVLVVLIDSAVEATHRELRGAVTHGLDAVTSAFRPDAHGTAMASAIIAHDQLVGVAPAARIVSVRAFDPSVGATTIRLLDSLQWTATSGARVVNMSFTGPSDPQVRAMLAALRQKGVVLVAAAGNEGPRAPPAYPAAYPEVIAVTATDMDDRLLKVANRGSYVAVAAPGVDIFGAVPGGYDFSTGTSVATAHVSGIVALLLERNPKLTVDEIQAILMQTAKDLGPKGRDDEFGAGLVDAYEALLSQTSAVAQQPPTR